MSRAEETVTFTEAPVMFDALAAMVAEPGAIPCTGTFTLDEFAAKLAEAGTPTAPVLLEVRLAVKPPAGAGVDRFN